MRSAALFAVATGAAFGLSVGGRAGRWDIVLPAMLAVTAALILSVRIVVEPAIAAADTPRRFAVALRRVVADPADLRTATNLDYGLLFYWGEPIGAYDGSDPAAAPAYLLATPAARSRMSQTARRAYRVVPGLAIEPGASQRYPTLLQRFDEAVRRRSDG